MPTHDYILANGTGPAVRSDLNDALAAIVSNNSSATAPATTYAYMPWADTTAGVMKMRNGANSAWITLYQLDGEWTSIALENGTAAAPSLYFKDSGTDTGIYSPGVDQIAIATAGVQRANFNAATEVVINDTGADVDFRIEGDTNANLFVIDAGTDQVRVANLNGGQLAGIRNRIINGAMAVDQRNAGAAQTITAAAALAYSVDRWYAYCTGANVTGQRVQGASVGQFRYRFTGAASVTAIGFGQRIEQLNTADLAGTTATLSVDLANSVLTTVTWTAYYATTADAFGTLASPTRTQIATGTFTVNSTVTRYSTQISVPAAATTGIEIVFTVGAQTSGTWTIGDVQLEPGTVATPFERRSYEQEETLCKRYHESLIAPYNSIMGQYGANAGADGVAAGFCTHIIPFTVTKRATPSVPSVSQTGAWAIAKTQGYSASASHTFVAFGISTGGVSFSVTRVAGNQTPTGASVYIWECSTSNLGLTITASAEL